MVRLHDVVGSLLTGAEDDRHFCQVQSLSIMGSTTFGGVLIVSGQLGTSSFEASSRGWCGVRSDCGSIKTVRVPLDTALVTSC